VDEVLWLELPVWDKGCGSAGRDGRRLINKSVVVRGFTKGNVHQKMKAS
jgi:hypothetical protein